MSAHATLPNEAPQNPVESAQIPDKLFFRIGEAAELCGVQPYVLRFWESEFKQLKPTKGSGGQRMYRRKDVETAMTIKRLLHEEGYTIAGAREKLKAEAKAGRAAKQATPAAKPEAPSAAPIVATPVVATAAQEMAQAQAILSAISLDAEPESGDLFTMADGANLLSFPAPKLEAPTTPTTVTQPKGDGRLLALRDELLAIRRMLAVQL